MKALVQLPALLQLPTLPVTLSFKIIANNSDMEFNSAPKIKNNMLIIMDIFYQTVFVLIGLDFGFFRYKCVPVKLCKLYSLIYLICIDSSIYFYFFTFRDFWQFIWFFAVVIKFNLFKLRLIYLTDDDTFCHFHSEISFVDFKIGIDSTSLNMELKIFFCNFLWICLKLGGYAIYWLISKVHADAILLTPYLLMAIGSELFFITYAFIFYAIYSRMRIFNNMLEKTEWGFSTHQQKYKLYVDIIEKYKNLLIQR